MEYKPLEPLNDTASLLSAHDIEGMVLFCGIANPKPLISELSSHCKHLETITFKDHHAFTDNDVEALIKKFQQLPCERKILVTTEKDYARLKNSPYLCKFDSVPLFAAPISIHIFEEEKFNEEILNYVRKDSHDRWLY